ncbi:hypothetical protein E2I00_019642 [Balaenoptera physalus]|uniref:E3 ligase CCCH-type zinc finger domain-containing protein n=1 Tax=Balaenoptera physalus TaxID=9770 RepID=A0A6A1QBS3_BALPH|nr:hypothetical protein E2I00_019642 [Balaenoptera physalus]
MDVAESPDRDPRSPEDEEEEQQGLSDDDILRESVRGVEDREPVEAAKEKRKEDDDGEIDDGEIDKWTTWMFYAEEKGRLAHTSQVFWVTGTDTNAFLEVPLPAAVGMGFCKQDCGPTIYSTRLICGRGPRVPDNRQLKRGRSFVFSPVHIYLLLLHLDTQYLLPKGFQAGNCTWGMNCRFIHPGVNDKGNYSLITKAEPFPPNGAPPLGPHPLMPANPWGGPVVDEILPPPPPEPPTESAWERGLRHAKEVLKKATIRKEQEPDFEEKRFTVTIGEDEREFDKENEVFRDWNYRITRDVRDAALPNGKGQSGAKKSLKQPPGPSAADPYYDYEIERFWRGGQYENFRVQYTEAEPYHNYRERERERERENRQRERERERERDRERERRQRERERERERERDKERQRRKEEWERERAKRDEKDRQHRERDKERDKEKEKPKARSPQPPSTSSRNPPCGREGEGGGRTAAGRRSVAVFGDGATPFIQCCCPSSGLSSCRGGSAFSAIRLLCGTHGFHEFEHHEFRQAEPPKKETASAGPQVKRADEWKDPWRRSKSPKKKLGISVSPSRARRRRKTSASSASASNSSRGQCGERHRVAEDQKSGLAPVPSQSLCRLRVWVSSCAICVCARSAQTSEAAVDEGATALFQKDGEYFPTENRQTAWDVREFLVIVWVPVLLLVPVPIPDAFAAQTCQNQGGAGSASCKSREPTRHVRAPCPGDLPCSALALSVAASALPSFTFSAAPGAGHIDPSQQM